MEKGFLSDALFTVSIVDIGSNSVRMNIYEIDAEKGTFSVVSSSRAMLRLAAHVEDGKINADGEGKIFALLRDYLAKSNSVPCDDFKVFATASLRGVSNAQKITERVKRDLGVDISIISGEDEARYDYIATVGRFGKDVAPRGVVIDMGGGSTELIAFENGEPKSFYSLPIGSLALWRSFCSSRLDDPFPRESERGEIEKYVAETLKEAAPIENFGGTAYLIGGTARALSNIDAFLTGRTDDTDGYVMDAPRFSAVASAAINDAKMLRKICPARLTSIVPGAVAYEKIIAFLGANSAVVSLSGVREGYISEYIRSFNRK
ncbi:MAG: hypothetical protein J5860_00135 [Clostridia bacterium]|nr:hypothetical protein [Clostridia bacterium]MBO4429358.1 hypothetical protein [Clostridia bacterium]